MSRSRVVIKLMDEAVDGAKPITDFEGLKINQDVIFADGHELAGVTGVVVGKHPERQTVDLKVGRATKIDVPVADLLMWEPLDAIGEPKVAPLPEPVVVVVASPVV